MGLHCPLMFGGPWALWTMGWPGEAPRRCVVGVSEREAREACPYAKTLDLDAVRALLPGDPAAWRIATIEDADGTLLDLRAVNGSRLVRVEPCAAGSVENLSPDDVRTSAIAGWRAVLVLATAHRDTTTEQRARRELVALGDEEERTVICACGGTARSASAVPDAWSCTTCGALFQLRRAG